MLGGDAGGVAIDVGTAFERSKPETFVVGANVAAELANENLKSIIRASACLIIYKTHVDGAEVFSAEPSGVFAVPKPPPNENDEAVFVAELVAVVDGLASLALATGGVEVGREAKEKPGDGVALLESFELERFNENPLLFASSFDEAGGKPAHPTKMEVDDELAEPKPENTEVDVTAGELPKPVKTEVVAGVAESDVDKVVFDDFDDPLLSFSVLFAENGLAIVEAGSPNENPFVESPELERSDVKLGVPVGALMVTTGESSFFSGSLNVNEAFSLFEGGLFSSCFFSTTLDGSL